MVIRRSDQVCQSAPSPARARRAKRECVCARARVSVCACVLARACVLNVGDPQSSLGSSTLRLQAGQWGGGGSHLWVLSFPRRGLANSGLAVATSNPGRIAALASPRTGDPGLQSRARLVSGMILRTAEPGTPGLADPRSRSADAVAKPWNGSSGEGLQVGKGVISICFFYGVLRLPRGVDAYSLESCSPRNPLCPCLFHRTVSQPEAQAIRGGGAPPSVSLSPSKWGKGRPQANRRTQTRRSLPFTKGLVEGAARGAELLQGIREASRIGQPHRAPGRETLLGPELVGGAWEGREELTVRLSRLPQDIHTHIRRNRAHPPRPNWTDVLPLKGSLRGKFLPQMYTFF